MKFFHPFEGFDSEAVVCLVLLYSSCIASPRECLLELILLILIAIERLKPLLFKRHTKTIDRKISFSSFSKTSSLVIALWRLPFGDTEGR